MMSERKKEERGRRKKNTRGFLPLAASSLLPLPKFLLLCKQPELFPNRAFQRLAQLFRGRLACARGGERVYDERDKLKRQAAAKRQASAARSPSILRGRKRGEIIPRPPRGPRRRSTSFFIERGISSRFDLATEAENKREKAEEEGAM
jgi:hypothetical protein